MWTSPDAASSHPLTSCYWTPEKRPAPPSLLPSWGSHRQQKWGHPSAPSLNWTNLVYQTNLSCIFKRHVIPLHKITVCNARKCSDVIGLFSLRSCSHSHPSFHAPPTTTWHLLLICRGTVFNTEVQGLLHQTTNFKRKHLPSTQSQTNYLRKKR